MKVLIMRGIPGAGKDTWISRNVPNCNVILSTDDYHVDEDGVYRFKPDRLGDFHDKTLRAFTGWLGSTYTPDLLVVNNTNIKMFEIAPYYRLAQAFGRDVEIVWVHCDPELAARRGLHGVPAEKVREMAQLFEPIPPWWKVRHVYPNGTVAVPASEE